MNNVMSQLSDPNEYWRSHSESLPEPLNKLVEDKDYFKLKLNLAGAPKENVDISFEDNMVTVLAQAEDDIEYHYKCHIPSKKIEPEKAEAKYENGILDLHIPKAEKAKSISIEIV